MSFHPRIVTIKEVISSRYKVSSRPQNWDERISGTDVLKTVDDEVLKLVSDGGQSTPKPGWKILLKNQLDDSYEWTLFAMA